MVDRQLGLRLVARPHRAGVALQQLHGPLAVALAELEVGLGGGELGAVDRIVEREQQRALLDRLALGEVDALDPAVDLGADVRALVGAQGAGDGHRVDHLADLDLGRLDGDRRRAFLGRRGVDLLRLGIEPQIPEGAAADGHRQGAERNGFRHGSGHVRWNRLSRRSQVGLDRPVRRCRRAAALVKPGSSKTAASC